MRILHLIDHNGAGPSDGSEAGGDAALIACRSLVTQLPEHEHLVCLVGGSDIRAIARSHGLSDAIHIVAPIGRPTLAYRSLRRIVADRGCPSLVQCWSVAVLSLHQAAIRDVPCAAALLQHPIRSSVHFEKTIRTVGPAAWWLSRSLRRTPLVVLSVESERAWHEAFENIQSVRVAPLPGAETCDGASRETFRDHHGIEPNELVLLLLGQSPSEADAMRFMFLLDLLHVSSPGIVGLVSGGAGQIARGLRFQSRRKNSWRVFVSDRPMPDLLSVADVAVCSGNRFCAMTGAAAPFPSTAVHIGAAHRMGVPVVAPRSIGSLTLYPRDAEVACVAFNAALPELARKLLVLHNDRELLSQVSVSVTRAAEAMDGEGFADTVQSAWQEARNTSGEPSVQAVTLPA